MSMSGYFGPGVWQESISDFVGYPELLGDYTMIDIWIPLILSTFFIAHLPECVRNVIKARRAKGLPVAPVFLDWTPMVVFTVAI